MEKEITKKQITQIIRRRKKGFITLFLFVFLIGFVIAIALHPIYKSEAIIRVNEQEIPENYVQSSLDEYVEARIEKINQQILNRPSLEQIIEDLKLYPEGANNVNISEIIEKFRENIGLEMIVSEMQSKPGGKDVSFAIAFNLSYEGRDPKIVQLVTDKLSNLYVEADARRKQRVVSATTDFLKIELERLKANIESQEKKISEFKKEHLRELPSDIGSNIHTVSQLERELDVADLRLRNLQEKKLYLESQLATTEPFYPIVIEGDKIAANPNQRLRELNIQLTKLRSIYSDRHPDIKNLQREINELESKIQNSKTKISDEKPENPAYINLVTQVNAINLEIQAIEEDKKNISASLEKYQERIQKAPVLEKELNALTRDYEASKIKYQEILTELMAAQAASEVEGKQQGERFVIASPAYLPTKPYKPNRLMIILVSLIIAIGASFIFAAFQEGLDDTIKTADQLKQITGVPFFSSISFITTDSEKRLKRLKKLAWFLIIIACVGVASYFVNENVIKLDYLWSIIVERLKMIA